jgi:hypothetical protein
VSALQILAFLLVLVFWGCAAIALLGFIDDCLHGWRRYE